MPIDGRFAKATTANIKDLAPEKSGGLPRGIQQIREGDSMGSSKHFQQL
jgi:hypothetical protein